MFHAANQVVPPVSLGETQPSSLRDGWLWAITSLLRYRIMVIAICLVSVSAGVAIVMLRPPIYTAVAHLQLTNLRLAFSRDDAFFAETQLDPTFIETQLQILRSDRIILGVVDNLRLDREPLTKPFEMPEYLREALALLPLPAPSESGPKELTDPRLAGLKAVKTQFSADRLGLSSIVQVRFSASTPETAARVANDLVRAYVADQNAARQEAAQAGSSWLRERLREVGPKTRIIAAAIPPTDKSNMRGLLIIGMAGVLGLGLGGGLAFLRSFLDKAIRTPEQGSQATAARFLGLVPWTRKDRFFVDTAQDLSANENRVAISRNYHDLLVKKADPELLYTMRIAEARIADSSRRLGAKVIGVAALTAGEGSTTVSAKLALSLALAGRKVLLVDLSPYDAGLTHGFRMSKVGGLVDYAMGSDVPLSSVVAIDRTTGLHVLPIGKLNEAKRLDWLEILTRLLAAAKPDYELIILDLPPATMAPDARSMAHLVDGYVLVLGWGMISAAEVKAGLSTAAGLSEKMIGFILNGIRLDKMRWSPSSELALARLRRKNRGGTHVSA